MEGAEMEAYKTVCQNPKCGCVRFWTGYKTDIGKTPEQLDQMHKDQITCIGCGSTDAKTELDCETEVGKIFDEQVKFLGNLIAERLRTA